MATVYAHPQLLKQNHLSLLKLLKSQQLDLRAINGLCILVKRQPKATKGAGNKGLIAWTKPRTTPKKPPPSN